MVAKGYPVRILNHNNGINEDEQGNSIVEPHVGLEFDTAEEAREFYNAYAAQTGFKVRNGQLYRSKTDGTISSRRFVCSKEGFQLNSRTGCIAFIHVQRRDTGKWVLDQIHKEHNHELVGEAHVEVSTLRPSRAPAPTKLAVTVNPHRPKMKVVDEADREQRSSSASRKRFKGGGEGEVSEDHHQMQHPKAVVKALVKPRFLGFVDCV